MASNGERQSVAIISAINGAINVCRNEKRFSRVDMSNKLNDMSKHCEDIRNNWSDNYTEKDIAWTLRAMDKWANTLYDLNIPPEIQTPILIKFSLMASEDMLGIIRNKTRLHNINKLANMLYIFGEFVDPEGIGFMSYEAADVLLNAFYKEIGFVA